MQDWRRTHTCGELTADNVGDTVRLNGWVTNWRDHGGLAFIDLRDRYGITQVVFDASGDKTLHEQARTLRSEWVVAVEGVVERRTEGQDNPKIATGAVEVRARALTVLNRSRPVPFDVSGEDDSVTEETRLKHRFLDLRRPQMQKILVLRHRLTAAIRDHLAGAGFLEIETPMLGRSTPEGARDYLVPSRLHHGHWYALPQSPQLYKQIMMIAGYDKYYQVARCFRDEDLRANRQPEFTQVDIEMSFVQTGDVLAALEGLCREVFRAVRGEELRSDFPRLTWHESMERFGNDRPDLRFGMELVDVTDLAHRTDFKVFTGAECVRGLTVKGGAEAYSRRDIEKTLTDFVKDHNAKGLAWLKVEDGKLVGPVSKFFAGDLQGELLEKMAAADGDVLLFVADTRENTHAPLSALRNRLGRELKLYDPAEMHFSWVTDFPMFERDDETGRLVAMHHPFTSLLDDDWDKLEEDPTGVRAKAYDLVINGEEAGGGTIRIHDPEKQQRIFNVIGLTDDEAEERFGFLLEALRYGAPPHGGIALGLDRWVMLFAGLDNIRDCIAFPKTQRATDLLTGAPGAVDAGQLKELGVALRTPEKK